MKTHHDAGLLLALLIGHHFLVVSLADHRQHRAVATGAGLDDMGNEFLIGHLIDVFHRLFAVLLVFVEIVVGSVGLSFLRLR